ncbi:MAG: QueT transporter family protein [Clostridia bacterium]|nr:QueT transporter family protein [Clostridia bacterium]
MKNFFFSTKRLCRAGIIAALYVALTYAFAPFAYGPFQVRPAEALCLLALIYPEAIPALYVGCMLSNLASPYILFDVFLGSLATLIGAIGTFAIGKAFKNTPLRIFLGGLCPILSSAVIIPVIIVFLCGGAEGYASVWTAYLAYAGSLALTETVWVYALGTPIVIVMEQLRKKKQ